MNKHHMELIPAIDIIDGACVRLSQGDYDRKTVYFPDPVDFARQVADRGIGRLHVVDLDGAKTAHPINLKTLERIVSATGLEVQFGGGVKSAESLDAVFSAGAARAICGSIAVVAPDEFAQWIDRYTPGRIILGADVKEGKVATHGWLESSELSATDLIGQFPRLTQVLVTDISRDGMMQGPSFGLYAELQHTFPDKQIIVSGGVSSVADVEQLIELGLPYAVVGKALYQGAITLDYVSKTNHTLPRY